MADPRMPAQPKLEDLSKIEINQDGILAKFTCSRKYFGTVNLGRRSSVETTRQRYGTPDVEISNNSKHNIEYIHASIGIDCNQVVRFNSSMTNRFSTQVSWEVLGQKFLQNYERGLDIDSQTDTSIEIIEGVQYQVKIGALHYSLWIDSDNVYFEKSDLLIQQEVAEA